MCLGEALRQERCRLNLTQEDLGNLINYSSKTVSAVENGHRKLPDEAKMKLAQLSPRLAIEICSECPANVFSTYWLDGDVDLSPIAATLKMIEESSEFTEALKKLNLINKRRPEQLTAKDKEQLEMSLMELMDFILGGKVWAVVIAQTFGIDLEQVRRKHEQKLVDCRYVKKRKVPYKGTKEKALGLVAEPRALYKTSY